MIDDMQGSGCELNEGLSIRYPEGTAQEEGKPVKLAIVGANYKL